MSDPELTVDLETYLAEFLDAFEPVLKRCLHRHSHQYTPELLDAVVYTPLAGGKRIRPAVLDLWSRGGTRSDAEEVLLAGVAIELIHSCSLVLDDLPSMDDARMRRGQPACHQRFGLDTAILAANAHLMLAFELLGELDAWRPGLGATALLARAVGIAGMVGGQHVDLHLDDENRDLKALEYIHRHKTGVLFEAAAVLGVRLGGHEEGLEENARIFSRNLGLAFQIKDDLLDLFADSETTGKDSGQDQHANFVKVFGEAESEEIMRRLLDTARGALEGVASRTLLTELCDYVAIRTH